MSNIIKLILCGIMFIIIIIWIILDHIETKRQNEIELAQYNLMRKKYGLPPKKNWWD